jgi:hypothetical protein
LCRWPADKSDGLGTTSRITQVTTCDVDGGPVSSVDISSQDNVKQYFDAGLTQCIDQIPSTRKSQALIYLGKPHILFLFHFYNILFIDLF